jgi:hypothetical protein
MTITMEDSKVTSLAEVRAIIKNNHVLKFRGVEKREIYDWIAGCFTRLKYHARGTSKADRRDILTYIVMHTGYSRIQVKRFAQMKELHGKLLIKPRAHNGFQSFYTPTDVALLSELDTAHGRLSGNATKALIARAYTRFNDLRFERLYRISVSHLYNLRGRKQYISHSMTCTKTTPTTIPIGMRKKPLPNGKPGYLRVDSVHQGDRDKEKGVYHINLVDEVTQWEIVLSVEGLSEYFLLPALEAALRLFPFHIINFHSDNGSEYINYQVATMLEGLLVKQTKSRSRHSNDNALVECKNGAIIRKHMGYVHIPKRHAGVIDAFYRTHMDSYVNYHRVSAFPTERVDKRGKIIKTYETWLTPFEKLETIPNVHTYLREGVTMARLATIAEKESDLECAKNMQKAKQKLFETFKKC